MSPRKIVLGQPVTAAKRERARRLRREMTPEERLLWEHVRSRRLQGLRFRRQQVVRGFILDFYCHAAGVGIEMDGGVHDQQVEYDADRDHLLHACGIRMMRVKNEEIRGSIEGVLARIIAFCQERE